MVTTGMIQLASHVTSVTVCTVLAAYFLREFLNKRLRASLWWAAGFSLFAFGILFMTGGVLYGFHTIFVMLTFAFVTASVAFLYYAASLHFLDRKSFFREKFTVILFVVSFVLFVLPVYFLSEEYMSRIVESPAMILFAVAFLVLAVLFNQFVERLSKKYHCERRGTLQSLAWWIISCGSLCFALFYGSDVMMGLVLVLSLCGFVLLLYGCKGGINMKKAFIEENNKLNRQIIDGVEDKIKRKADSIQVGLNDSMQKIGDALIYTVTAQGTFEELGRKNKMVARASKIGVKEDELVVRVVELAENILELARSAYEDSNPSQFDRKNPHQPNRVRFLKTDGGRPSQPDKADPPEKPQWGNHHPPPLALHCTEAGGEFSASREATSGEIKRLAALAFFKSSTDRDMIETCCELVRAVCNLENNTVTKIEWKELSNTEHPGGMIGHTYNILYAYGEETGIREYAKDFRERFQGEADERLEKAKELERKADSLIENLPPTEKQGTPEQAEEAAEYLNEAIVLLQNASLLIKDASGFVGNRLNSPRP